MIKKKIKNKEIFTIKVQGISKIYQMGEVTATALYNASFTVDAGEYVLLSGRSGSGKSTLLNIMTGVDKPSEGEVFIGTEKITDYTENELAKWRGKNIGIVFQFFQLIPTLSVLENILLPMDIVGVVAKEQRKKSAIEILKAVGMEMHRDKMPSELSGGEQQRVAIARSLANNADIIFADEPTGNLDLENAGKIYKLLKKLNERGKTIIMVSHERENIPGITRKIILKDGKIVEDSKNEQTII